MLGILSQKYIISNPFRRRIPFFFNTKKRGCHRSTSSLPFSRQTWLGSFFIQKIKYSCTKWQKRQFTSSVSWQSCQLSVVPCWHQTSATTLSFSLSTAFPTSKKDKLRWLVDGSTARPRTLKEWGHSAGGSSSNICSTQHTRSYPQKRSDTIHP